MAYWADFITTTPVFKFPVHTGVSQVKTGLLATEKIISNNCELTKDDRSALINIGSI